MEDKVGTRIQSNRSGEFIVLEYNSTMNVKVKFVLTGYETHAAWSDVIKGNVKDRYYPSVCGTGFLGEGVYKSYADGKMTKHYTIWCDMIFRCYSPRRQLKRPTYKGCSVCNDWHNFQNFAKWYDDNYPKDGGEYQLDKDIKINGNKVYSPDTCLFVTIKENIIAASAKYYTAKDINGVEYNGYNLADFCRQHNLHIGAMSEVARGKRKQHKGWKCKYT